MATAANVVGQILAKIITRQAESPIQDDEAQDTIDAMNNWMATQDAIGINLGYTFINGLGDQVTIPVGALQGLISNVAIEMSPTFGAPVTPPLANSAKVGLDAMRKLARNITPMSHPSTLPIGSGNEHRLSTRRFYPGEDEAILTEQGGFIATEDNTVVP